MTPFKRLPLAQLITSTLALAFYSASGFSADDDLLGSMSLEKLLDLEVVTASKTAQKISDAPATVYVVTADQIANRGYRHLDELLEDIPEIEIQRHAVAEYNNFYTFRGISGNEKFIVLLDGFRIASPTGTPHAIASNYGLADAKRVEVILGPASALYGADAFGGIVNIITRSGEDADGVSVHVGGGEFETRDYSVNYGIHIGEFSFNALLQTYDSEEPNFAEEYPSDFSWYNNEYSVNGNIRASPFAPPEVVIPLGEPRPYGTPTESHFYHFGARFGSLEAGYVEAQESHNDSLGMLSEFNLYVSDAVYVTKLNNLFLKHTYNHNDSLSIQSSMSQSRYELLPESNFQNTFTGYAKGYKYEYDTNTKFEEQANILINETNVLVAGLTYEQINSLPKTGDLPAKFDPDTPAELQGLYYLGTDTPDNNGNSLKVPQVFFNISYENIGYYAQWQSSWFDDVLKATVGARYDDNTRYGSTFNPRVGVVYKPISKLTVKYLYSTGFFAPSPYLSYQHYGAFFKTSDGNGLEGFFWHLPNPNLKPETLKSHEISAAYTINDHFKLSANYYQSELEDLITPEVFNQDNPAPPELFNGSFQGWPVYNAEIPVNKGTSSIDGGTLRLDTLHQIAGWTLNGSLSYSASDGDKSERALTYSAKDTWKAGMEFGNGAFSFYPEYIKRSESLHKPYANGEMPSNPAFSRWDLYAQYKHKVSSSASLAYFVRIKNLTDEHYYNVTFADVEAFGASPQDPRRIEAGVIFKM